MSDPNAPQFYLVEVELAKHNFFSHIFPQITKFFAFYKNHKQQKPLIESLLGLIEKDKGMERKSNYTITNTYTITPCKVGFILLALSLYFLFTPYEEGEDI